MARPEGSGAASRRATTGADITNAIVFVVGAAGTFAIHHKWLTGWQQWEKSLADAAAMPMIDLTPDGNYDPAEFAAALAVSPAATGGAEPNGGGGNGASAAGPADAPEVAPVLGRISAGQRSASSVRAVSDLGDSRAIATSGVGQNVPDEGRGGDRR